MKRALLWGAILFSSLLFAGAAAAEEPPAEGYEFIYEEEPLTRLEQAQEKAGAEQWEEALALFQKIVDQPADKNEYEQGLLGLAECYERMGNVKLAVHYYRAVERQGVTPEVKSRAKEKVFHYENYVFGQFHIGKWYPKLWLREKTEALAQRHPDHAWHCRVGIPYLVMMGFKLLCLFGFAAALLLFSSASAQTAPRRFDAGWGIPSLIVIYLLFLALQIFVVNLLKPDLSGGDNAFVLQLFELILSYLILVALVLLLLTWRGIAWRKLGIDTENLSRNLVLAAKYIVVISILFGVIAFLRYHGFLGQEKVVRSYPMGSVGGAVRLAQALLLVGVSPLCEEIFYRGFVYPVARNKTGFLGGILLTSLFFALVHVDFKSFFLLFGLSTVLCYLYEKSRNLIPAVCVHAFYNFVVLFGGQILSGPAAARFLP